MHLAPCRCSLSTFRLSLLLILVLSFVVMEMSDGAAFANAVTVTTKHSSSSSLPQSKNHEQQQNDKDDRLSKWLERWNNNTLGWHLDNVNESLVKYQRYLFPADKKDSTCSSEDENEDGGVRVLVPLCGKTVDMAFLASQESVEQVVGIDGIRKALTEFINEHPSLEIEAIESSHDNDKYERFQGHNISLLGGDFFNLDETTIAGSGRRFDSVWDRASIVAIHPDLREAYVETISNLIKPGVTILLATLERRTGSEEGKATGPPYSIPEDEVRRLYEGQDWVESVELLEEIDQFERRPTDKERFEKSGVTSMYELIFLIKAKQ